MKKIKNTKGLLLSAVGNFKETKQFLPSETLK